MLHASIGTMSGCLLNIILDPVFILPWGPESWAAGEGFATFCLTVERCCISLYCCIKREKTLNVCLRPDKFTLERHIVMGVCRVGIPALIQNLLNVTGNDDSE